MKEGSPQYWRNKERVQRAIQRALFPLLESFGNLPAVTDRTKAQQMREVVSRVLAHADHLGWLPEDFIQGVREQYGYDESD